MKSISKTDQRKLYKMYEEAVEREASNLVQVMMDFGKNPDRDEIREGVRIKKAKFASFLEDGVVE